MFSSTSSSSLVHPYSPLLQQQQQPSNNTNNNNNNKKQKKTNSPTGLTATTMITSQAGSPSLVVPLLPGETTNRPPAKPASLPVSSSVSPLIPADHPLPPLLLSPADHQYPHPFFVTSLSSPFSSSTSSSLSSSFPPPPPIHQQSPSSSSTPYHPPPSPPPHPSVFPHHHLHPPPHVLLHQHSNFASSPTSSSPSSLPLSEPNHHRHPSLQHQRTDSPSSLKQQQQQQQQQHHHHHHHTHSQQQKQQQQDHKQQQHLLLYKHQRQQQLRMMQQQNNILQQQQHQQQQLFLQRQNQQKLELKQQQKQHLQQLHLQLNPPRVNVAAAASEATPTEATRDYQSQQTQAQVQAQQQQQCNPSPSPTSATQSFVYPSLQQRRASLLQQRPVPPTVSLPPPSTSNTSQSTNNSLSSVRTPMLTLSPQKYQGLVASGALPVRQALQTHIASSGEKPPETKEEARAALEVMFQIRADKIRRAIEEGKLATTEALQHKVIRRRESVVEGSQKSSKLHHSSHPKDRSMSAPSERITFSAITQYHTAATATTAHPPQSLMSGNVSQQPWLHFPAHGHVHPLHSHPSSTAIINQEPLSIHGHANTTGYTAPINNDTANVQQGPGAGTTAEDPMVIEAEGQGLHDTTFGLSDDDIMSSFTDFTAKLGDSLLARGVPRYGGMGSITTGTTSADTVPPLPGYNLFGINANQQDSNNRVAAPAVGGVPQEPPLEMMMVDTVLPILSPTASSESQSPSPWIPWHGPSTHERHDSMANSLSGATEPGPMAVHPFAQARTQAQHTVAATVLSPSQAQQRGSMSTLVMSQQQQPDQQSYPGLFSKDPRNQGLQNSSAFGVDAHSVRINPQGGLGLGEQGVQGGGGGSYVDEKLVEAWNQYLQYLLHQQEFSDHHFPNQGNNPLISAEHGQQIQHRAQQDPFIQQQQQTGGAILPIATSPQSSVVMDPHWQATMMTMMLDQNPTREAIHGLDQQPRFNIVNTVGGGIVGSGQRMTSSSTFPPTGSHLAM